MYCNLTCCTVILCGDSSNTTAESSIFFPTLSGLKRCCLPPPVGDVECYGDYVGIRRGREGDLLRGQSGLYLGGGCC